MPPSLSDALPIFQLKPKVFVEEVLGATCEAYQDLIFDTVAQNSRTAISSCHNLGKSWTMARVTLWAGACFPGAKIITTAPTYNQVKNILWSEIRSAYSKSRYPLGGVMLQTEWQITEDWFALGFTTKNQAGTGEGQGTQSSFQGFHAPLVIVIFDEATGIPPAVWVMAEGLLTSANVKFIAIGNPTSKQSDFFKCFTSPDWAKIKLTCFDSPNLQANGITDMEALEAELDVLRALPEHDRLVRLRSYKVVKPYLLSTDWVMRFGLRYGVKHPLFISKAIGEFPDEGDNVLIPLGLVEEAQRRAYTPTASDRKCLGVDVARYGTDSTVFTYLHGYAFKGKRTFIKTGIAELTGEVIAFCREHGAPDVIVIDETGLGGGLVDNLNMVKQDRISAAGELLRNTDIKGIQFGAGCTTDIEKEKYINQKARMFDLLSEELRKGLCLPHEDVYLDELPLIRYSFDNKGRKFIESKDDFKKRTGRKSPDDADSLALANLGRYDELDVGKLTEDYGDTSTPISGGLGQW